jgi:hypothetical protein
MTLVLDYLQIELNRINARLDDLKSDKPKILQMLGITDPLGMMDRSEMIFLLEQKKQQFEQALDILVDK